MTDKPPYDPSSSDRPQGSGYSGPPPHPYYPSYQGMADSRRYQPIQATPGTQVQTEPPPRPARTHQYKPAPEKKRKLIQIWHFVCAGLALLCFGVCLFMWMGYLTAEHQFCTEARLVDMSVTEKTRQRSKDDPNYSNFNREETYYQYRLTWQFMDPDTEQKYTYERRAEASHPHAHEFGETNTIFVYYSGNIEDFSIVEPLYPLLFALGGIALLIVPSVDIIRSAIRRGKRK